MVPFGLPVVPDVNAINAVSSPGRRDVVERIQVIASAAALECPPEPRCRIRRRGQRGQPPGRCELVVEPRVAKRMHDTTRFVDDDANSFATEHRHRPDGHRRPLITASQQAAIAGLLGPRSSTRLPGDQPELFDQHTRIAVARSVSSR